MPTANSYSTTDVAVLDTRHMDLFNLISAPNPAKVKTGSRPRAAHEVLDMEDPVAMTTSSETPSVIEKSPLDFSSEDSPFMITNKGETEDQALAVVSQEVPSAENIATMDVVPESMVLTNHIFLWFGCKSSKQTTIEIPTEGVATTEVNVQFSVGSPESGRSTSAPSIVGSPSDIYLPRWGVTNDCRLDIPEACQDMVDHTVPLASGSGFPDEVKDRTRVREEEIKRLGEEVKSLKVMEMEVHSLRNQTKNLETLPEAEVDMKKAMEAKNAELAKDEERIKAAFKEFKKYEDNKVEQRCAKMYARLDKLSVDIDEELYPHMLTAIAGLAKGMSEVLKYGIEHGKADRDLADVEAYDPEANKKLLNALQDLKDLKYPMIDQLEKLKDAPVELIMASLHLESDTGEDAPHRAEKKKKRRVVFRTHGIGFTHHARSDGIPVLVPTVVPQGLAILLTDAGMQTQRSEDEASPRFLRRTAPSMDFSLYAPSPSASVTS
ncbi:hypothetical protein Tco_1264950 [Tanacetum coccineum]